ncbi:MAG: hypothetical protein ACX94C_07670 [Phycisphaerales bacterium]
MGDRKHQLVGPYAEIHRELMSHPANWRPREGDDADLPFYEWSLEGPAGTGKTYFEGTLLEDLHQRYPRLRSVVIRKTRVSLTDSWMQVFEDDVLGPDHPVLQRGPSRAHRSEYSWDVREGRSVTRVAGMDNPTRLFSTQYDVALVVEGIEFGEDDYQSLFRAMRNTGAPFKAMLVDTNPGNVTHFLNRRPDRPGSSMKRVLTKHWHNPAYVDPKTGKATPRGRQYFKILDQLQGVMRKRLRDGLWCSAEGAIYEHFSQDHHVFDPGEPTEDKPFGVNCPEYEYFMAAIDFGHLDATCLQVWGVTKERSTDMLGEWYGTKVGIEQLAQWVLEAHKEFDFVRCVADHRPELIEFLNNRFGWRAGRDGNNLVMKAQKGKGSVEAGLYLVQEQMGNPAEGKPTQIRFSSRARRYTCPILKAASMPLGVVDEIPGYVWAEQKEDRPAKNQPDPGCVDHGCDAMRYLQTEVHVTKFGKDRPRLTAEEAFTPEALETMSDEEHAEMVKLYGDM